MADRRWMSRGSIVDGRRAVAHRPLRRRRKVLRAKLYLLQRGRCFYCGVAMLASPSARDHDRACTLDEVKPRGLGGWVAPNNCVAACRGCNGRKGRRTSLAFVASWPAERRDARHGAMLALRALIIRRAAAGCLQ